MATGIPYSFVENFDQASVAQKFSWASKRQTTRVEDVAYSLMGLFGVNMPPLYGEGECAFLRLQLEILSTSDDESIFAWKDSDDITGSLLARSPAAFAVSGVIPRVFDWNKPHYLMTNKGLRMECYLLPAILGSVVEADDTVILPLQCVQEQGQSTGVLLRHIVGNRFARVTSGELVSLEDDKPGLFLTQVDGDSKKRRVVYVRQSAGSELLFSDTADEYSFSIPNEGLHGYTVSAMYKSEIAKRGLVSGETRTVFISDVGREGILVVFELTRRRVTPRDRLLVIIALYGHRPRLVICVPREDFSMGHDVASRCGLEGWNAVWDEFTATPHEKMINCNLSRRMDRETWQAYVVGIEFGPSVKGLARASSKAL